MNPQPATTPAAPHSRPTSRPRPGRTMQVCVNCRDRHVKCDHRAPCSACKELKKPWKCEYIATSAELKQVERRRVHKRRRKTTTCENCRKKKRKCSKDRPECTECRFDGLICSYDPYPRKEEDGSGSYTASSGSPEPPNTYGEPAGKGDPSLESPPVTSGEPATDQGQTPHEVQDFHDAPNVGYGFPGQQYTERTQSPVSFNPQQPTMQRAYGLPALPHRPAEFNPLAIPFPPASQYPTSDLRYQGPRGPPGAPVPQTPLPPQHQPQQQGGSSAPQPQGAQDLSSDQHHVGGQYEAGGHAIRQGNVRNAGWPQSVYLPWPHRAQPQNSPLPPLPHASNPHATAEGQRHLQWLYQTQQQHQHRTSAVRNEQSQSLFDRDFAQWQDGVRDAERERREVYQFALGSQHYRQRVNAVLPRYQTTHQHQALPAYPTSLYTGPQQLLNDRNTIPETNRRPPARSQRPAQQPRSARTNHEGGEGEVPSTSQRPDTQQGGGNNNQNPELDSNYDPAYYFAQYGRPPAKR